MTADERIEKLLNHFGQTIADLPKPTEECFAYTQEHRDSAEQTALVWSGDNAFTSTYLKDYICHLADVIDRMEVALETALIQLDGKCNKCSSYDDCDGNCFEQFRIIDTLLIDPELEIEIDDAD